jgi:hypothetical protein
MIFLRRATARGKHSNEDGGLTMRKEKAPGHTLNLAGYEADGKFLTKLWENLQIGIAITLWHELRARECDKM